MDRCGVKEQVASRAEARAALQTNTPYYFIRSTPRGVSVERLAAAYEDAFSRWTAVANVKTTRLTELAVAGARDVVNIIDGADLPSGVLADQVLGNGTNTRLQMRVSNNIDWNRVSLADVLGHEQGHMFGLAHFPPGPPPEWMEPVLSGTVTPQPTEAEVVRMWFSQFPPIGPNPTPNPPTPPTPTPKPGNCCFRFKQDVLTARIPMALTPEQEKALAALDCQALLKGLFDKFLAGLISSVCPAAAQQAIEVKPEAPNQG